MSFAPIVLFFISGATALGCEMVWLRSLAILFGATAAATGTLLAAFMGGLAAGSVLGGRVADRARRPGRLYGACEAVVAGFALASPALFRWVEPVAATSSTVGRVAIAFALLAAPTIAMGASLPLLAAATIRTRDELGAGIARLYGVNVLGAMLGVLVTGYALIPDLGVAATTRVLAVAGVLVAAIAVAFAPGSKNLGVENTPPAVAGVGGSNPRRSDIRAVVPILLILGAVSFALQVAWNRTLAVLLGSSAYTFALVAASILGALAFGAAAPTPDWHRISRRLLALAILTYLGVLVVDVAPSLLIRAHSPGLRLALAVLVAGAPSWQVGALFPALASRLSGGAVGRTAGRALAFTTLGNLVGSLGAAFVLLPEIGAEATILVGAAVALALAVVAATRAGKSRLAGTAIAATLALGVGWALLPRWDPIAQSAGAFRTALYRHLDRTTGAPCGPHRLLDEKRVLFDREGAIGRVVVLELRSGDCVLTSLRINGKTEGSVFTEHGERLPIGDLPTEILAGKLPGEAGPPAARALVVGWGTGISIRALLDAGAQRVDGVEIEPAVIDAGRSFDAALPTDPRVRIVLDDARLALRRARPASYDVIVSQPSNPWVVGASALFSREYFQLLRSRLARGGRALAWVQLYEIDRATVRSLVATFLDAFPDAVAVHAAPDAPDLLLLAGGTPPPDAIPSAALKQWSAGAPINTDDNARIEYRVADRMLAGEADPIDTILEGLTPMR